MKKEYITPGMRVKKMAARKILCGSNLGISNTTTTKQFSRDFDDFEEEDW